MSKVDCVIAGVILLALCLLPKNKRGKIVQMVVDTLRELLEKEEK